MGDCGVASLLEALRSPSSCGDAWTEFLQVYSPVLYQTARSCTSDNDAAADCYLHICQRLSRNGFRRLLKFKPEGSASFNTWLRVVARNLCFDWHRSHFGRPRPFESLQHLSPVELEVYRCRFIRGASQEETLQQLESLFPAVSLAELSSIEARLQGSLTSRQHWILGTRKQPEFSSTVAIAAEEGDLGTLDHPDPAPSQEERLADHEQQSRLEKCVRSLPAQERFLVQLRFEQDLSLDEIAQVSGLHDAQQVHRKLAAILKKLRGAMR